MRPGRFDPLPGPVLLVMGLVLSGASAVFAGLKLGSTGWPTDHMALIFAAALSPWWVCEGVERILAQRSRR